eukprot:3934481-Rhodomonas_salina.5
MSVGRHHALWGMGGMSAGRHQVLDIHLLERAALAAEPPPRPPGVVDANDLCVHDLVLRSDCSRLLGQFVHSLLQQSLPVVVCLVWFSRGQTEQDCLLVQDLLGPVPGTAEVSRPGDGLADLSDGSSVLREHGCHRERQRIGIENAEKQPACNDGPEQSDYDRQSQHKVG